MAERRSYSDYILVFMVLVLCAVGPRSVCAQESFAGAPTPVTTEAAAAPAPSAPTPSPTFDLEKFLVLDPGTIKLTGLEDVSLLDVAAIYPDASGQLTAELVANRYLRKDRPTYDQYRQMGRNPGAFWVVAALYNQSGPSHWALDFGNRLSGRLGRIQAIKMDDMVLRQTIFSQGVFPGNPTPAGMDNRTGRFLDQSVMFDIQEAHVSFMVMRVAPALGYPAVFNVALSTEPKPVWHLFGVQVDQLLSFLAVFGAGAAVFAAVQTQRYYMIYFAVLMASLPLGLLIPGGVFTDSNGQYDRLLILIFGVQSLSLALCSWALARAIHVSFGNNLVHAGIIAGGAGLLVAASMVLSSTMMIGALVAIVPFAVIAFIGAMFVFSFRVTTAVLFSLVTIIYVVCAGGQVLSENSGGTLFGVFGLNAAAFSIVAILPLGLMIIYSLPFFEGQVGGVSSRDTKEIDHDRERYDQLRLAKESFDYNNLLKVIEHERKQLAAARTREMVRADEMRKAKDLADEANRAKSAFLAVVSHEIRTPMTGVLGMVKLLEDTTLTKTQRDYAQTIKESGNAMMGLLNDILDFEKIESGKMQLEQVDFDLHRLLNAVVTLMGGHASSKGIDLSLDIDFSVPNVVIGDMARLRQVLLNLIGNAIKFTKEGGVTIKVSSTLDTELQERDGVMLHHVYFAIEDTGIGIPPSAQKNIFTPFSQADKTIARKFGGSGLGLAISRRLIESMGSTINIKSREGVGTTFFFTLNLPEGERSRVVDGTTTIGGSAFAASMPDSMRGAGHSSGGTSGGGGAAFGRTLRIMVVEDNNITQRVLQTLIEKEGHGATIASSAEEAIGFLEMGERFDLIFADINLTGMTGLEFTRIVRNMPDEGARNVPIVALSGSVEDSDIAACRDAGMTAHLAKPLDPDAFMGVIYSVARSPAPVAGGGTGSPQSASGPVSPRPPVPAAPSAQPSIPTPAHHGDDISPPVTTVPQEPAYEMPVSDEIFDDEPQISTPEMPMQSSQPRVYATLEMDLIGTLYESLGADQLMQLLSGLYTKAEEIIASLEAQDIIDPEFTRARAHEMKGMAGNFGFQQLSDAARNIEKIVKTGSVEGAKELIAELTSIYQQSRNDVDDWLRSM